MLSVRGTLRRCKKWNFLSLVQWSSSSSFTNFPGLNFQPKFSTAEQEKILNILNESSCDQLSCFNIAQSKIRNLESYKKRKGPFKTLEELLEVDGLSVKMLEKLCKQLITDAPRQNVKSLNNDHKKLKQFLVPPLSAATIDTLNSAVGIHLGPTGVSWAKIVKFNNELECWGYNDFGNLPKKLYPTDTFYLAMKILNQIPYGDAYVFEGANNGGLQGQKQSSAVTSYTLQLELTSMLLALINTSKNHNKEYDQYEPTRSVNLNCVYFLRSKLPARLFRTLVGNECVSNTGTVLHLLGDSPEHNFTLSCSPITVQHKVKNDYLVQTSGRKELLGQALMLTIAFMDLCVKKNPLSVKAVMPGKR